MVQYNPYVRITEEERLVSDDYCKAVYRTRADVMSEFIRSLKRKNKNNLDGL